MTDKQQKPLIEKSKISTLAQCSNYFMQREVSQISIRHLCAFLLQKIFSDFWLGYNDLLNHRSSAFKGEFGPISIKNISDDGKLRITGTIVSAFFASRLLIEKPFEPLDISFLPDKDLIWTKIPPGQPSYKYSILIMREMIRMFDFVLPQLPQDYANIITSGYTKHDASAYLIPSLTKFADWLEDDPYMLEKVDSVNASGLFCSDYVFRDSGVILVRMGCIFPIMIYHRNEGKSKKRYPYVYNLEGNPFMGMPYSDFPDGVVPIDPNLFHRKFFL